MNIKGNEKITAKVIAEPYVKMRENPILFFIINPHLWSVVAESKQYLQR